MRRSSTAGRSYWAVCDRSLRVSGTHPETREGGAMAELTQIETKIAEVIGLAQAAQGATEKVSELVEDGGLKQTLEQMHREAVETEERTTQVAEKLDGKKTAILEKVRNQELQQVIDWATPIQERHLDEALRGSLKLAAEEDPNEPA